MGPLRRIIEEVTISSETAPKAHRAPPKVKGPIRCHKCQLKCRDAEHYLSHECKPSPAPECAPFPTLETSPKGIL